MSLQVLKNLETTFPRLLAVRVLTINTHNIWKEDGDHPPVVVFLEQADRRIWAGTRETHKGRDVVTMSPDKPSEELKNHNLTQRQVLFSTIAHTQTEPFLSLTWPSPNYIAIIIN